MSKIKMPKNIDLQCHTTASDGALAPKELVELALKKGLKAVAITDHDSVNGLEEALNAAKGKDIEVIPGVEISCDDRGFVDTHILGLFISHKSPALKSLLKKAQQYRERQKKDIIKKFQELGFKISFREVKALAKGEIRRPHIARAILQNNPHKARSIEEIFDKYLAVGKKAYVELNYITQELNFYESKVMESYDDFGDFCIKLGDIHHLASIFCYDIARYSDIVII